MSEDPAPARLQSVDGRTWPIHAACSLGRASTNDLPLEDEGVSRRHALIHRQGEEGFWLIDLGSSNGTRLNDRAVIQPVRLTDRDRIGIGRHELTFHAGGQPETGGASGTFFGSTVRHVRVSRRWLLLADIQGFTPLSQELAPERLARMVGGWFAESRHIVEGAGGTIHKYLGDGWFAAWDDATSVPAAVAACLREFAPLQLRAAPAFRMVLHHGEVTSSGSASAGDLGMLGPDVNFVFRLEKLAGSLNVPCLFSQAARNLLRPYRTTVSAGRFALKGFEGEHEFFA